MDRALQRRVRFGALQQAHCRNLGRRGSTAASWLLAAALNRAASDAERKAIVLLRNAGLTGWRTHHVVNGYELDFAFPEHRLAVEVDGWAWHRDVERFRRDRQRQNALVLAGWTILRFTWHDLTQRAGEVIAVIRAGLDDRQLGLVSRATRGLRARNDDQPRPVLHSPIGLMRMSKPAYSSGMTVATASPPGVIGVGRASAITWATSRAACGVYWRRWSRSA